MSNFFKHGFSLVLLFTAITANATDFSVLGADVSLSGFATAGFAISDQNYKYQRFINNDGTFKRDSIVGGQLDIKFNNQFSLTTQATLAPSMSSDDGIEPTLTWAFLSWRPTNDLMFRAGRVRIPLYLNSQNKDIGATFDFARLPVEIYSTSPTDNVDGLLGSKTWNLDVGDLTLESYVGTADTYFRTGSFDYPPLFSKPTFIPMSINLYGASLTFQHEENLFRIGAHDTYSHRSDHGDFIVSMPFVSIIKSRPNIGYFQVDEKQLPGPGIPKTSQVHSFLYTVGTDIALGDGYRLMGEYMRREVRDLLNCPDTMGGYLALLKSFDEWTPYISVAHLQSTDRVLDFYKRVKNNRLPAVIPNSALINASQRAAANTISVYDETTWAIGTSYQLSPTSKLKAEWAITQTGDGSSFVEVPRNGDSANQLINVFSFSYNVVF